jgi:hypothetical protein
MEKSKKAILCAALVIVSLALVISMALVAASSSLSLTPNEGPSGTVVTISGSGFTVGTYRVYFDRNGDSRYNFGEPYTTVIVSAGVISTTLTIPSVASGTYYIRAGLSPAPYTAVASTPFTVKAIGNLMEEINGKLDALRGQFGNVYYVDQNNGNDANDGLTRETALKTITAADALCTDNHNDYIVFKGKTTSGGQYNATEAVITKKGVHLVGDAYFRGMGGGYSDSCLTWANTAGVMDSNYGTYKVGLQVKADGVEIAGIKFYNPDATQAQYAIGFMDSSGGGRGFSVHDCYFQGQYDGPADRTSGIIVIGVESGHIYNNFFYACETTIKMQAGGVRYCTKIVVEKNVIQGSKYGVYLNGLDVCDNVIIDNDFVDKGAYGYTMVNGILIVTGANGNYVARNMFGTTTATTAITNGGTNNMFIENYDAATSGTLVP